MTLLKKMIKSFRINIKIKQIRNKTKHVIYLTQCTMFQSGFTQVYIGMFTGVKYLLVLPHSVSGVVNVFQLWIKIRCYPSYYFKVYLKFYSKHLEISS